MKTRTARRNKPADRIVERHALPEWTADRREVLRRLPPLQALAEAGVLTSDQAETGRRFAAIYAIAAEHRRSTTPRYGTAAGREVDELVQARARRIVARELALVGEAGPLLIAVAVEDQRPALVDLPRLRAALEAIRQARRGDRTGQPIAQIVQSASGTKSAC